tara:strand:- start:7343 stop:8380 length:1038 start_codon:yes stop_codon:yes gene_type:complete
MNSMSVRDLVRNYNLSPDLEKEVLSYVMQYLSSCGSRDALENFYSHPDCKPFFHDLSFKTNFAFNSIMCDLMGKMQGKFVFDVSNSMIDFSGADVGNLANRLREDGYCIGHIDGDVCTRLVDRMKTIQFKEKTTNNIVKYGQPKETYTSNSAWCVSHADVVNIPEVQELIGDGKLLSVIQEYLGTKPILTQTNLWFTHNVNTDFSTNAQLFHRDFDHERWLKVFVYLSDVTRLNGPHCFVRHSHREVGSVGRGAYTRESDDTILRHYPKEHVVMHEGRKGTVIIEDTRGYHKGLPVIDGERIMLQLEYSINPSYGRDQPSLGLVNPSESMKERLKSYPYIYQNTV